MPPNVPQPLHSILLVIKTRSGPRLVLHYPPSPDVAIRPQPLHSAYSDDSLSDGHDYGEDKEDASTSPSRHNTSGRLNDHNPGPHDADTATATAPPTPTSEYARDPANDDSGLEFGSASADSMARLLAPSSRGWNKKRFELTLEDRTYLACPMFEREEGGWKRVSKKAKMGEKRKGDIGEAEELERHGEHGEHDDDDGERLAKKHAEERDGSDAEDAEWQQDGTRKIDATAAQDEDSQDGDEHEDVVRGASRGSLHDTELASNHSDGNDERLAPTMTSSTGSIRIPERPKAEADSSAQHDASFIPASFATTCTSGSIPSQSSSVEAQKPQTLSMFSLVFVLEPDGENEFDERINEIYKEVVRKLTKALRWTQKRHGWLWTQCRTVIGVREKGKERGVSYKSIWPSIAARSGLARALATTFDSIKAGEIAQLQLCSSKSPVQLSLQIPQIMTTGFAPTAINPVKPGLFTTTYGPLDLNDLDSPSKSGVLSPHSAILLLMPLNDLLRELTSTSSEDASSNLLIQYIRHSVPTKTLAQLARTTRISLQAIQALSAHLIQWRRAIAIPPLHASHIYVVNPNADFSRLEEASTSYAKRFPLLPGLIAMLSKLSGTKGGGPQPYSTLIPSSDHKASYMEILECLMRDAWITHLRTFAWVRISPAVKAAVARQLRDESRRDAEAAEGDSELEHSGTDALISDDEVGLDDTPSIELDRERKRSSGGSVAYPAQSPRLRALLGLPKTTSDAGSSSSAMTTVRISNGLKVPSLASRGRSSGSRSSHSQRLSNGSSQSNSRILSGPVTGSPGAEGDGGNRTDEEEEITEVGFEPSLVLSPHRADALESRWLKHVGDMLPSEELRSKWPKLVRYFDGKHALEEIALRQGWKRKVVTPLLQKLMSEKDESGVLRVVRHW